MVLKDLKLDNRGIIMQMSPLTLISVVLSLTLLVVATAHNYGFTTEGFGATMWGLWPVIFAVIPVLLTLKLRGFDLTVLGIVAVASLLAGFYLQSILAGGA